MRVGRFVYKGRCHHHEGHQHTNSFLLKDRRNTKTIMNAVFEKSAMRSLSCATEYTEREKLRTSVHRRGVRPVRKAYPWPLHHAKNVTGWCTGCLHNHRDKRQGCRRPRAIENRNWLRSTSIPVLIHCTTHCKGSQLHVMLIFKERLPYLQIRIKNFDTSSCCFCVQ
jgi:hypothetical protein